MTPAPERARNELETPPPPAPLITPDELAALHAAREALGRISTRALHGGTFAAGIVYRSADSASASVFQVLAALKIWVGELTDADLYGYSADEPAPAVAIEAPAGELEALTPTAAHVVDAYAAVAREQGA